MYHWYFKNVCGRQEGGNLYVVRTDERHSVSVANVHGINYGVKNNIFMTFSHLFLCCIY